MRHPPASKYGCVRVYVCVYVSARVYMRVCYAFPQNLVALRRAWYDIR